MSLFYFAKDIIPYLVLDGRITQLTFRNGEVHTFLYA